MFYIENRVVENVFEAKKGVGRMVNGLRLGTVLLLGEFFLGEGILGVWG